MEEEYLAEPETKVILSSLADNINADNQIPLYEGGESFTVTFVYQWIYIWGRSFKKLAATLDTEEEALLNAITNVVEFAKNQLGISPLLSKKEFTVNKTSDLVAAFPPHTSIVHQSSSEELSQ